LAFRELRYIIEDLQERANKQDLSFKSFNRAFFKILEKNSSKFEEFKNEIRLKWETFKIQNQNRVIKRTFTSFFYENFHGILIYFLHVFFGFNENSLNLFIKEKISDKIIFFDYNYTFNPDEEDQFIKIANKYQVEILYGFSIFPGYLYFLIRLLGMTIRNIIQENIFILLDGVNFEDGVPNKNLNFMIICKDSKDEIFVSYYKMVLFYFLRQFNGIPEEYYDDLLRDEDEKRVSMVKSFCKGGVERDIMIRTFTWEKVLLDSAGNEISRSIGYGIAKISVWAE